MIDRRGLAAILVAGAIALPKAVVRGSPVVCPFRRATGLPCPACGLTRSWQAAAHLDLGDSLAYHPLGGATLLGAIVVALGGSETQDGTARFAGRRDIQLLAGALWLATWLVRVRRSSVA